VPPGPLVGTYAQVKPLTDNDSRASAGAANTSSEPRILTVVYRAIALVRAAHAPPTIAVTALATAIAATSGRDLRGTVLVAGAVLTGQLSIGWCNDLVDRDRDRAAGRPDKPVATGEVTPRAVTVACAVALTACIPLSLASGWLAGLCHLVGVAGGWAYDLGLKRTLLSWVPYAVSFAMLGAFLSLGLPGHPAPHGWVVAGGALLGVGAHFLNVVPDVDADRRAGVLGLPQRLGATRARTGGAVLLAAAAAVVTLGPGDPSPWALAGLGLAVVLAASAARAGRRAGSRLPFLLALATAAVTVALLVGQGSDLG
jgi:4-hydroxybenzoate polyprenyltransferase